LTVTFEAGETATGLALRSPPLFVDLISALQPLRTIDKNSKIVAVSEEFFIMRTPSNPSRLPDNNKRPAEPALSATPSALYNKPNDTSK
jgi:hypothetical protein